MTGCTFHQNDVLAIVNRLIEYPLFSTPLDKQSIDSFGVRCIDSMSNVECFRDPDFKSAEIAFPMNWTDILGDSDNEYFAKSSLLS